MDTAEDDKANVVMEQGLSALVDVVAVVKKDISNGGPTKRMSKYDIPPTECPRCWLDKHGFPVAGRTHNRSVASCSKYIQS